MDLSRLVECAKCRDMIDLDAAWIADEGTLCRTCCRSIYGAERVPIDLGHHHVWKRYDSFTHVYEICDCGEKRDAR